MKRTNLVLDEDLLKAATQVLAEAIRTAKIRDLAGFFGKGVREGDLKEMREDRSASLSGSRARRRKS
ncbi:hypothetical protein WDW86_13015 [Bdellovibrionota bacterium FG-2]